MTNGFSPAVGDPHQAVQQLLARTSEMARRAQAAGERISQIAVTVTSRNRAVSVTAGSGGVLKAVTPGPAASGMSPVQLCAAVMDAYARASRQAAREASDVMAEATGRDTKAMQMMRDALPPDPDADGSELVR